MGRGDGMRQGRRPRARHGCLGCRTSEFRAARPTHREEAAKRYRGCDFVARHRARRPLLQSAALLRRLPRGGRGLPCQTQTDLCRPLNTYCQYRLSHLGVLVMMAADERGIGSTSASRLISPSAPMSQKLAISARSAAATSRMAGAWIRPVAEISKVAMSGAVPLKTTADVHGEGDAGE